jgi:predicted transcriptional regulator of viral defense system
MSSQTLTQADHAMALLRERGMARQSELTKVGVTATTIARMKERGLILQLSRGLYQRADHGPQANHELAQASRIASQGVICLVSALAFHELTDTMPPRVWVAIGSRARKPRATFPPVEYVRFNAKGLRSGVDEHLIEGVSVKITNPAKTIVDLFRYRRSEGRRFSKSTGLNAALEGLKEALRQGKATPAEIARYALEAGNWKVIEPYLEAMTVDG